MFSRKKPEPAKRRQHDLSQFGLTDIPDDFDPSRNDDDDDSDLEAELAKIAGGAKPKTKPKVKQLLPENELDKMIADSMRDVSDDDNDEADELENDTDLLGELQTISGVTQAAVEEDEPENITDISASEDKSPQIYMPTTTVDILSIITQRIEMYKLAESQANVKGESAKARRFKRGLNTLHDLYKQSKAGKSINIDDIPPELSVKQTEIKITEESEVTPDIPTIKEQLKQPLRPAPAPPTNAPSESIETINPLIAEMRQRQNEYKTAALQAKRRGDTTTALQFLKVVKQFDVVIKMCEAGQEVDLSDMPPQPEKFLEFLAKLQQGGEAETPVTTETSKENDPQPVEATAVAVMITETTNMLEALQQRLNKYKSVEDAAKTEGNASKARRFGRIVKQYEDAIKLYKAGKEVAYDELPVPPGFGPLPSPSENTSTSSTTPASKPTSPASLPSTVTTTPGEVTPIAESATPSPQPQPQSKPELTTRVSGNQQKNNLAEQQMKILLERQKEFKLAAIDAKKTGEIEQAKEYLKIYKGFDALLNAASSGLPVDLTSLPVPPTQRESLEASFAIISSEDCDPNDDDISDIGVRIEEQLAKQLMMCKNTRDHHKAMGDIAGMNRFENLALIVQKDLDLVRYSKRKNFPLPKFHYEKRSFNIVHCNTDLTDNELEINIIRGINYNVPNPKDVDTYVKLEFPLLNDETYKAKTNVIKDTDNPDYNERFTIEIQRGNRQFQRIFKRHGVKIEVYTRGGFLRSDTLIGTVNVKLQPLETKCDIHDTYDLMEGRKQVGGKLELKLRVRNPILTKQIEHINEKWLVLETER